MTTQGVPDGYIGTYFQQYGRHLLVNAEDVCARLARARLYWACGDVSTAYRELEAAGKMLNKRLKDQYTATAPSGHPTITIDDETQPSPSPTMSVEKSNSPLPVLKRLADIRVQEDSLLSLGSRDSITSPVSTRALSRSSVSSKGDDARCDRGESAAITPVEIPRFVDPSVFTLTFFKVLFFVDLPKGDRRKMSVIPEIVEFCTSDASELSVAHLYHRALIDTYTERWELFLRHGELVRTMFANTDDRTSQGLRLLYVLYHITQNSNLDMCTSFFCDEKSMKSSLFRRLRFELLGCFSTLWNKACQDADRKRPELAKRYILRLLEFLPGSTLLQTRLAFLMRQAGEFNQAVEVLLAIVQAYSLSAGDPMVASEDDEWWFQSGVCTPTSSETRNVSRQLGLSLNDIGSRLVQSGKYKKAIRYFAEAARWDTNPASVGVYFLNRGDCHFRLFNHSQAVQDYQTAKKMTPRIAGEASAKISKVYNEWGTAYFNTQQYGNAESTFSKAIEVFPFSWEFLLNRARCRLALGNDEAALRDCFKSIVLHRHGGVSGNSDKSRVLLGLVRCFFGDDILTGSRSQDLAALRGLCAEYSLEWPLEERRQGAVASFDTVDVDAVATTELAGREETDTLTAVSELRKPTKITADPILSSTSSLSEVKPVRQRRWERSSVLSSASSRREPRPVTAPSQFDVRATRQSSRPARTGTASTVRTMSTVYSPSVRPSTVDPSSLFAPSIARFNGDKYKSHGL